MPQPGPCPAGLLAALRAARSTAPGRVLHSLDT